MRFYDSRIVASMIAFAAMTLPTDGYAVEQSDTLVLSLDRCIEIALSDNPTIKVADMEITRTDYSKKEVLGQLFPTISFGGSYSRTLAKQTMYMNMDGFGGMGGGDSEGDEDAPAEDSPTSRGGSGNGIKVGLDNSYQVGFNASMPLIAPQLWKSLKLSDTQILQNIESARASRLSLVNQVKNAYYTLLLAMDSRDVIQESYDMARFTADLYARQFELGAATKYDVLRTEVAVKNIEPELSQAEISIKQARLQLLVLMGMDAMIPVKPDVTLSRYESTMYEQALGLSRDISGNTDLKMLDLQTRSLNDALAVQKASWYPTLALTASYNWTSMNNGTPFNNLRWNPYSMVGVTLSFPLFEGGQRYYKVKQAQVQVNEMAFQRENLERALRMQVDVSIDNINTNVKQISSCSESVKQAEVAHDIVKQSFEIGAATYLQLRDGELALTQARLAYYQAIYNYLVANSELEYLLGSHDVSASMPVR
ncbi:MAG: TolC family protein [Duncaniella sp.]|nr:TolC family protein [Duncaniella sp.]HBI57592.1 TolC family protein [Porphyromonadaceae bacterium]